MNDNDRGFLRYVVHDLLVSTGRDDIAGRVATLVDMDEAEARGPSRMDAGQDLDASEIRQTWRASPSAAEIPSIPVGHSVRVGPWLVVAMDPNLYPNGSPDGSSARERERADSMPVVILCPGEACRRARMVPMAAIEEDPSVLIPSRQRMVSTVRLDPVFLGHGRAVRDLTGYMVQYRVPTVRVGRCEACGAWVMGA
jgi:hypothetical protein